MLEGELKTKAAELEKIKLKNFHLEQQALNHTRTQEGSVRDFEQVGEVGGSFWGSYRAHHLD